MMIVLQNRLVLKTYYMVTQQNTANFSDQQHLHTMHRICGSEKPMADNF